MEKMISINDKAAFTFGTKKTIYEHEENLEDETLRLIMNPQDTPDLLKDAFSPEKTKKTHDTREDAINRGYKNLFDKKHPNAMVFDQDGRLFVGDSHGQINVWSIRVSIGQVDCIDHQLIKHKEIEGD